MHTSYTGLTVTIPQDDNTPGGTPMANHPNGSAEQIAIAEIQRKALELRKAGATYDFIAKQLGYADESGARYAVKALLNRTDAESADNYRALQMMELNDLRRGLVAQARSGNLGAIDRLLKIQEREAKLLGLDAPDRGLTVDVTKMTDEELEQAWQRMRR